MGAELANGPAKAFLEPSCRAAFEGARVATRSLGCAWEGALEHAAKM